MTYGGQVSPARDQGLVRRGARHHLGHLLGPVGALAAGHGRLVPHPRGHPGRRPHLDRQAGVAPRGRVVGADGEDGDAGELLCRSPSVMQGYFKDPERTAEVMRDGWVHTGDIVRQDDDGNLFFLDRLKDMIKTGGLNVSSQEVERALQAHPDVVRAAVVGLPDDYWSEVVTAFVVAAPRGHGQRDGELREHCKESMAGYKVPKAVHLVDELPVDPQGKLLKRELRRVHGR